MKRGTWVVGFAVPSMLLGLLLAAAALLRCAGDTDGCDGSGRDVVVAVLGVAGVAAAIAAFSLRARRPATLWPWAVGLLVGQYALFVLLNEVIPGAPGP